MKTKLTFLRSYLFLFYNINFTEYHSILIQFQFIDMFFKPIKNIIAPVET